MFFIAEKKRGFTSLEIMLVVTFLGVMLGLGLNYYRLTQVRVDFNAEVDRFVSELRLARSEALAGSDDQDRGVHLDVDGYVVFVGNSYDEMSDFNYEVELPSTMEISNISLNGGGSDIVFEKGDGETGQFGNVDFVSNEIGKTVTVNINPLGLISF